MTEPTKRWTIGAVVGCFVVVLGPAALAYYALFGNPTGRIGRNWEAAALTGVVGTLAGCWIVITGIRIRRR